MGMNKNNTNDLPVADYECLAASDVVQIATIQAGKNAGEVKAVVQLHANVGGVAELVEVWLTLDPTLTTSTGKKRINFTIDSLAGIGAVNAMTEIGAALEADPGCSSVRLSGIMGADGKPTTLATLHVSENNAHTNYDLWAKRKPAPKGLGAQLAKLGAKAGGKPVSAAANPFAQPTEDTSFPFGANAPAS